MLFTACPSNVSLSWSQILWSHTSDHELSHNGLLNEGVSCQITCQWVEWMKIRLARYVSRVVVA